MARVGPAVNAGVFTGFSVGVAGTKPARVGTRVAVMKFGCLVSEDESTEMEMHEESRVASRERIIIFLYIIHKCHWVRTSSFVPWMIPPRDRWRSVLRMFRGSGQALPTAHAPD